MSPVLLWAIAIHTARCSPKYIFYCEVAGFHLIRRDLPALCREIQAERLRLTLSTNGMRLPALGEHILPYIDELGLPLDGANEADNRAMRVSPSGRSHLGYVQKAIGFVLAFGRPIELTIRTVVSRRNAEALAALGDLIARIDWPQLRWKLYRFVPIGYGASVWPDFWIEQNCFDELVAQVRHAHPHLHIDTLDHAERGGRYLHIMPNGDAMTPTAQHEVIALGNAFADFDGMLAALAGRLEPDHNSKHGQPLSSLAIGAS